MTKHIAVDDGFPKYHMPLEEANKLIEANVKILSTNEHAGIMGVRAKPMHKVAPAPVYVKPANRAKVNSLKCRLGKIMGRLYDLEPECAPEKALNVEFESKLYQMEDY